MTTAIGRQNPFFCGRASGCGRGLLPFIGLIMLGGCNSGDFNSCERYYTSPWNPPVRCYARPLPPSLEVETTTVVTVSPGPAGARVKARTDTVIVDPAPVTAPQRLPPPVSAPPLPPPPAAAELPLPKVVKGYPPREQPQQAMAPMRSRVSGRWRLREAGGKACEVVLTNAGLLDQYKASSAGCASEALRSINGWDLKGHDIVLYARGAIVARLGESGEGYAGVVLGSGAAVTLSR